MIVLPTEKVKAKVKNPRFLILFGKPKSGEDYYSKSIRFKFDY